MSCKYCTPKEMCGDSVIGEKDYDSTYDACYFDYRDDEGLRFIVEYDCGCAAEPIATGNLFKYCPYCGESLDDKRFKAFERDKKERDNG